MKKIIIYISIMFALTIILICIVFSIPDKMHRLILTNYNGVTLDFGEYKVKNFKQYKYANKIDRISFEIDDSNEFYNKAIKQNENYNKKTDFDVKSYYAYGYIMKNDALFSYSLCDGNVKLEACFGKFALYDELKDSYDMYFLIGPFANGFTKEITTSFHSRINISQAKELLSIYDESLYKIDGDLIHLKGFKDSNDYSLSTDYLVTIYQDDNLLMVRGYDE